MGGRKKQNTERASKFNVNGTINSHKGNFDDTITFISLICWLRKEIACIFKKWLLGRIICLHKIWLLTLINVYFNLLQSNQSQGHQPRQGNPILNCKTSQRCVWERVASHADSGEFPQLKLRWFSRTRGSNEAKSFRNRKILQFRPGPTPPEKNNSQKRPVSTFLRFTWVSNPPFTLESVNWQPEAKSTYACHFYRFAFK